MSDLISRRAALEAIRNLDENVVKCAGDMKILAEIKLERLPVAYNKEKVVQELEKEKELHTEHYNVSIYKEFPDVKQRYEQIQLVIDNAIEKVKKGGING